VSAIKTLMPASEVLSAFALKRRRPTYENVTLVLASQILQVAVKRALTGRASSARQLRRH
jgi:hypothetical protein